MLIAITMALSERFHQSPGQFKFQIMASRVAWEACVLVLAQPQRLCKCNFASTLKLPFNKTTKVGLTVEKTSHLSVCPLHSEESTLTRLSLDPHIFGRHSATLGHPDRVVKHDLNLHCLRKSYPVSDRANTTQSASDWSRATTIEVSYSRSQPDSSLLITLYFVGFFNSRTCPRPTAPLIRGLITNTPLFLLLVVASPK
jgi:hypothetical protein